MVKAIEGVFTQIPLVVKENQEIDYEGIKENVEFLADKGIHGFIALDILGQFYAVSEAEFNKVVNACVDATKGSQVSVINCTWHNTQEVMRRTKYAEDTGADYVMIALPYADPLWTDGLVEHYKMIHDATDKIQIMVQNCPQLSRGVNIPPNYWKENLLRLDRIQAAYELNYLETQRNLTLLAIADRINVLTIEPTFVYDWKFGAKGFSSIFGLAVPKLDLELYEASIKGDYKRAIKLHLAFQEGLAGVVQPELPFGKLWGIPSGSWLPGVEQVHEAAILNAIAEIGGNKAGPPRKPYSRLPENLRSRLVQNILELKALER
jgi:4-hydroxy-tetrahydrodipicolinate synthase